ncbi:hypothetical protein HDU98_009755 [Podochytrium sp. JEL0797]|nr:hypothetical protein HDU98_009755 [Podochytrium sp. JEL0797]
MHTPLTPSDIRILLPGSSVMVDVGTLRTHAKMNAAMGVCGMASDAFESGRKQKLLSQRADELCEWVWTHRARLDPARVRVLVSDEEVDPLPHSPLQLSPSQIVLLSRHAQQPANAMVPLSTLPPAMQRAAFEREIVFVHHAVFSISDRDFAALTGRDLADLVPITEETHQFLTMPASSESNNACENNSSNIPPSPLHTRRSHKPLPDTESSPASKSSESLSSFHPSPDSTSSSTLVHQSTHSMIPTSPEDSYTCNPLGLLLSHQDPHFPPLSVLQHYPQPSPPPQIHPNLASLASRNSCSTVFAYTTHHDLVPFGILPVDIQFAVISMGYVIFERREPFVSREALRRMRVD